MPKRILGDPKIVWPEGKGPNWQQTPQGYNGGRFGRIEHAVVVKEDGTAIFDRLITVEGDHVICLVFGFDGEAGDLRIGLVKEARDTAAPADGSTSLSFWGPPRGFRGEGESEIGAARRETGEEAGASVVLAEKFLGNFITNETTTASWSPVVALKIDLSRLQAIAPERGEKIYKAEFFLVDEIEEMVKQSEHDGASCRSMVLITILSLYRLFVLPDPAFY